MIDETLTGTTISGLRGPGSNGHEGVIHILQSSRCAAKPSDAFCCHMQDTCCRGDFTPSAWMQSAYSNTPADWTLFYYKSFLTLPSWWLFVYKFYYSPVLASTIISSVTLTSSTIIYNLRLSPLTTMTIFVPRIERKYYFYFYHYYYYYYYYFYRYYIIVNNQCRKH